MTAVNLSNDFRQGNYPDYSQVSCHYQWLVISGKSWDEYSSL